MKTIVTPRLLIYLVLTFLPMLLFAQFAETYSVNANGANFYQDSYNPSEASEVYTHPQTGSLFDSKLDLNSFNGVNFATYTGSTTGTGTDLDTELDTDDPWIDVENPDDVMPLGDGILISVLFIGLFMCYIFIRVYKTKLKSRR